MAMMNLSNSLRYWFSHLVMYVAAMGKSSGRLCRHDSISCHLLVYTFIVDVHSVTKSKDCGLRTAIIT